MVSEELLPNVTRDTYPGDNKTMACSPLFLFVCYTLIVGTTSLLGLIGNTLSIVVLRRDRGSKVANLLLQTLAIADNCVLLATIGILSVVYALFYFEAYQTAMSMAFLSRLYFQPIAYITKTCAIWMTVLLAVNRYVVIKRPLQAQDLCTLCKARLQVIAVVVFSIVCNLPRFFHYERVDVQVGNTTRTELNYTAIGKGSSAYTLYTNFFSAVVLLLPMVIVIIMNVGLIRELQKVRHQRKRLSTMSHSRRGSTDSNITLVMCIIIVIFIVCHTPDVITQGIDSFYKENWWKYSCYVEASSNLLIALNSSVNFFVYYLVRKRFRQTLFNMLCGRRRPNLIEQTSGVTETTQLRNVSSSSADALLHNVNGLPSQKKTTSNGKSINP